LRGGHLRPAVYNLLPDYIKRYGLEAASEVADFEFAHVQTVAQLIKKEKIDCDFTMTKTFDVYTDVEKAKEVKHAYHQLLKAGVAKTTMDDLTWTDSDRAEEVIFPL
jgi:proline dehydrogenase